MSERDEADCIALGLEINALRDELSAVSSAIGTVRFMDPPDGGDVTLAEQVARMHAALGAAEANQRTLIAALRAKHQAQGTYPGDEAFDAADAQMLEPGMPIPEPPAAEAAQQWRPIDTAPRDGTPILVAMRHDIAAADDWRWAGWNGRYVVVRHDGVMDGHYDMGWSVAAPVGQGGLPDSWMLGWMPLPPPPEPRT